MFSTSKGRFDATKLKATLRLCSSRFDVAKHKKTALMKQNMREVAMLLAEDPPKEEKAMIRTERLIKDDYAIEAFEILQLECQLLVERVGLLKISKECPDDLVGCVSDLIFAAPRLESDITELREIRNQLVAKFGKKFASDADSNANNVVSQRIVEKLSLQPPTAYMVQNYMSKIAKLHQVDYEPTIRLTVEEACDPIASPMGYSVPVATGTGLGVGIDDKDPVAKVARAEAYGSPEQQKVAAFAATMPASNPSFRKEPATAFAYALEDDEDGKHDDDDDKKMPSTEKESASSTQQDPTASTMPTTTIPTEKPEEEEQETVPRTIQPTAPPAPEEDDVPIASKRYAVMTGLSTLPNNKKTEENSATIVKDEDIVVTEKVSEEEADEAVILQPTAPEEEDNKTTESFAVLTGLNTMPVNAAADAQEGTTETKDGMIIEREVSQEEAEVNTAESVPTMKEHEVLVSEHPPVQATKREDSLQLLRDRFAALGGGGVTQTAAAASVPLKESLEDNQSDADEIPNEAEEECTLPLLDAVANEITEREDKHYPQAIDSEDTSDLCQVKAMPGEIATDEVHLLEEENGMEATLGELPIQKVQGEESGMDKKNITDRAGDMKEDSNAVVDERDPSVSHDENVPTKKDEPDHVTGAAMAGGAVGFAVAGPLGGFLGAAGGAHLAANKKGKVGEMAKKCGRKVTKMTHKFVEKLEKV